MEKNDSNIIIDRYDRDFAAWKWVIPARSKDERKGAKMNVLVSRGELVATDGHRIHIAKVSSAVQDGQYRVIKALKTRIYVERVDSAPAFPPWQDVWARIDLTDTQLLKKVLKPLSSTSSPSLAYVYTARNLPKESVYDFNYFSEAIPPKPYRVGHVDERFPLVGKSVNGRYKFAIVPISVQA